MSALTVLILCVGAGCIGFMVASLCQSAASVDEKHDIWQQGREYGHAEAAADRDRAVTVVGHPAQRRHPSMYDWAEDHAHGGFQP